jgi:2-polyprenyl-6-methoxyphenol hydroxylase-like FAD-dependent oxidoreductase
MIRESPIWISACMVDRAPEPGTSSRALALQARTLELYRQLGFAREVIEAGLPLTAVNFWARNRKAAHISLGELGRERSPFPYGLIYPQDQHERFLIDRLAALGVQVERGIELTDLLEGRCRGERTAARSRAARLGRRE